MKRKTSGLAFTHLWSKYNYFPCSIYAIEHWNNISDKYKNDDFFTPDMPTWSPMTTAESCSSQWTAWWEVTTSMPTTATGTGNKTPTLPHRWERKIYWGKISRDKIWFCHVRGIKNRFKSFAAVQEKAYWSLYIYWSRVVQF